MREYKSKKGKYKSYIIFAFASAFAYNLRQRRHVYTTRKMWSETKNAASSSSHAFCIMVVMVRSDVFCVMNMME